MTSRTAALSHGREPFIDASSGGSAIDVSCRFSFQWQEAQPGRAASGAAFGEDSLVHAPKRDFFALIFRFRTALLISAAFVGVGAALAFSQTPTPQQGQPPLTFGT